MHTLLVKDTQRVQRFELTCNGQRRAIEVPNENDEATQPDNEPVSYASFVCHDQQPEEVRVMAIRNAVDSDTDDTIVLRLDESSWNAPTQKLWCNLPGGGRSLRFRVPPSRLPMAA